MEDKKPNKTNNKNTPVIILLAVLVAAVLGVGGYFVVKDMNSKKSDESSQTGGKTDGKGDGGSADGGSSVTPTPSGGSSDVSPSGSSDIPSTPEEIEAGITYAEIRGNDFYVEVQANGQVPGTCEISVLPTNGGQGHHDTDDLEVKNKVSICDEDFSLKGMNKGEHLVKVIIRATDGRTKTLEKTVNI